MAHVCIGDSTVKVIYYKHTILNVYHVCMDLGMWQLYQEHNYYYLLLYYSFCRETHRISVLILFKLLPGYILSVF